jgi:peptidoglycan hydrolase-like protein with peptidoglycan-binding domain
MSVFEKPKREITKVFLHCSASNRPNHDDVEVIRSWHKQRGWSDIGYHYFIRADGTIEKGRNIESKPAAQKGHNTGSIAICLHGLYPQDFTLSQFDSVYKLCNIIDAAYDDRRISFHGHCEVSNKPCPVFDYISVLSLDRLGIMDAGNQNRFIRLELFSRGLEVVRLQRTLNYWSDTIKDDQNAELLQVDGIFGQITQMRVMEFQQENGLEVDGVVGSVTRLKLPILESQEAAY